MPEITTRLGPWWLHWDIEQDVDVIFASLEGVSDALHNTRPPHTPTYTDRNFDRRWRRLLMYIQRDESEFVAASDAAREAIERERADLRREDAERYAQ